MDSSSNRVGVRKVRVPSTLSTEEEYEGGIENEERGTTREFAEGMRRGIRTKQGEI